MRLRDLNAHFVRYETRIQTYERVVGDPLTWKAGDPVEQITGPVEHRSRVESLADAQGLIFDCPKCNAGHSIEASFAGRGVADNQGSRNHEGKPSRWNVTGTGLDDLTLTPSVDCTRNGGPCPFHGFVTNGGAA